MNVLRLAAFAHAGAGGNPAGVALCESMPAPAAMLATAAEVGYSETAFLAPADQAWRVRYFAPAMEVPFCGHATIASAAVLGERYGEGSYRLILNQGEISVGAERGASGAMAATLRSPPTHSETAPAAWLDAVLAEFGWDRGDLDPRFPVRIAFAGARHLVAVLSERATLAAMSYRGDGLKTLMQQQDLVTVDLLWHAGGASFHARNAFPTGGVYEDPATGAAAAAFAGYLRDTGWQGGNALEIFQGEDMGCPSRLGVRFSDTPGEGVEVYGEVRQIASDEAAAG